VATAARLIDLREHRGVHPRIGACDVLPFVPLGETTLAACVALAAEVGDRIGRELDLPVYLYGAAARRPERQRLAEVRRGEYEGLAAAIARDPARAPDFGPARLGPAGAVAVGARRALVAYNVYISPADLALARAVAREVREVDGGLPGVQALGLAVARGVQVSLNIVDYRRTPPHRALAAIRDAVERRGGQVVGAELVGLLPLGAALMAVRDGLGLTALPAARVLELAAAPEWQAWRLE
jgi:glutamate formiminotransferase